MAARIALTDNRAGFFPVNSQMFCVRFYGGYPHIADFILPAAERYVNQIRLNGYQIIFFFLIIRDGIENRNAFIRGDKKHWKEDGELVNQVVPISMLQLGRGLENYESLPGNKSLDTLTDTLKRFHARSKLVICLLGTGPAAGAVVLDEEKTKKNPLYLPAILKRYH